MNTCQLLSAEVWNVANSKIRTKAVDKTLKTFINESKSVKIHKKSQISRKHRNERFSLKKANFTENVSSVKSWIRLVHNQGQTDIVSGPCTLTVGRFRCHMLCEYSTCVSQIMSFSNWRHHSVGRDSASLRTKGYYLWYLNLVGWQPILMHATHHGRHEVDAHKW